MFRELIFGLVLLNFIFGINFVYATEIPNFASVDSNQNFVPDNLEDTVVDNGWFTTIMMENGNELDWADLTLTSNISYLNVLNSINPRGVSWRDEGWRFATADELWNLFALFGSKYNGGPHYNSIHVGTDLSRLFGDVGDLGYAGNIQFTPDNYDSVYGFIDSSGQMSASLGKAYDTSVTLNLSKQTYTAVYSTSRAFDFSLPIVGSWLVRSAGNNHPTLTPIGAQTVHEGDTLSLSVSATDPDNDTLTYTATGLPSGATLNAETGEFTWTPGYTDAGTYDVTFTVTDDGEPVASASETVTITVVNTNRTPILTPIGNQTVNEGDTLSFTISATDPDGDALTYTAANLPSGATFSDDTFTWNTGYDDAGNYPDIEFTVMDSGTPIELAVELITITVGNVNRAPEIANPGPQEVLEDTALTFMVSATDPDGDTTAITATNLPTGASFDGTTFNWTPTLTQEGVYTVTFTTTDSGTPQESSVVEVIITVGDNPTPTEQAQNLIDDVVNFNFPQNVENSYLANLQKVEQFINDGKIQAALNQLQAFINKVDQDYGQGVITAEERDVLIGAANKLIADITG